MSSENSFKHLYYENNASKFDTAVNPYDLETRLRVVFDMLLPEDLSNRQLLDNGCGTGWFSKAAVSRGAVVTSLDVGQALLDEVSKKCKSHLVIGDALALEFENDSFDCVVSSDMIEHTENPRQAIREMYRVLRPGGVLALTCPNRTWRWSLTVAQQLGLRKYGEGHENWPSYSELVSWSTEAGFRINAHFGFHLFPFQLRFTQPILRRLDRFGDLLGPLYVNQALRAIK